MSIMKTTTNPSPKLTANQVSALRRMRRTNRVRIVRTPYFDSLVRHGLATSYITCLRSQRGLDDVEYTLTASGRAVLTA